MCGACNTHGIDAQKFYSTNLKGRDHLWDRNINWKIILNRSYLDWFSWLRIGPSRKMVVFWVVAPCSLVEIYQRFRGSCCLHHQGEIILTAVRTSNPTGPSRFSCLSRFLSSQLCLNSQSRILQEGGTKSSFRSEAPSLCHPGRRKKSARPEN
jgi:hypothetical protein